MATFDQHGLLDGAAAIAADEVELGVDDLASELADLDDGSDITRLRHVRSAEEKRAAEEIARRDKCQDFEKFKPLFEHVKQDLASGTRVTRPFELKAEIRPGAFFIVGGLISYVAEMEDIFTNAQGRTDARLRVIFDNGTESGMLMRSLQRQLHEDDAGRRITDPSPGPLFADRPDDGEAETGTIYVLRSKSAAQGAELIVIDTPPHADLAASKAAECADLVLIPCRPSAFDLAAMRTTIRLVELLARPAFVVFTAGPPHAPHIYADARELVASFGGQTCPIILPDRAAYRHAVAAGQTVFELDPGGKAASEIEQLHMWACEQLHMCTPSQSQAQVRKTA